MSNKIHICHSPYERRCLSVRHCCMRWPGIQSILQLFYLCPAFISVDDRTFGDDVQLSKNDAYNLNVVG